MAKLESAITLTSGTYVVAVSGGVDSVVLLDLLSKTKAKLVVAHFDHGIRHNSAEDAAFVRALSAQYGCSYEEERAELGEDASEEQARKARYAFLQKITNKYGATAVVTAHHQDDVIETSVINIMRGTGRHGLTSLKSRQGMYRPLLGFPKSDLLAYAAEKGLQWREDQTNTDTKYLRNKVRLEILPKMTPEQRVEWLQILHKAAELNEKLDAELQGALRRGLHKGSPILRRKWFIMLPHIVAKEVLIVILRQIGAQDIDKKTIERMTVQIKVLPHGKVIEGAGVKIMLTKRSARFKKC